MAGVALPRWYLAVGSVALAAAAGLDRASLGDGIVVVVFLQAMVVVAAAADRSGVLGRAARAMGRAAGRPVALLARTFLLAALVTVALNLDTTAVLFTPLAVALARELGQPPAPFALATLAAANFTSLLLPSSNLTNLVVWRRSGEPFATFVAGVAPAWLAATVVTGIVVVAVGRRHLSGGPPVLAAHSRPRVPRRDDPRPAGSRSAGPCPLDRRLADPRLARLTAGGLAVLLVAFVAGAPLAAAAAVLAVILVVVRPSLASSHLPPAFLASLLALFSAAGALAARPEVGRALEGLHHPATLAVAGAAGSAVGTNLAATLVLEPLARSPQAARALLVGVDLGVGLTPIASLATILWANALRAAGEPVPMRAYLAMAVPLSLVLVPLGLALAR